MSTTPAKVKEYASVIDKVQEYFYNTRPDEIIKAVYGDNVAQEYLTEKVDKFNRDNFTWLFELDYKNRCKIIKLALDV